MKALFNFSTIQFWWLESRKPERAGMDRRLFMWHQTYLLPENQVGDWLESCMADNFQTTQVAKRIHTYIIAYLE